MAENLKFDAPYSLCYDEIEGFCDTFGRFYSLHENGEDLGLFDQELLDTICPTGWRVPSMDDWSILANNMGGGEKAGRRLMSSLDFGKTYEPGSNDCGFNSLPAGNWLMGGTLSGINVCSRYWTSTAKSLGDSYMCSFMATGFSFSINCPKMTIRCIRN